MLNSCLTDPEIKLPYEGFVPVQRDDGWEISTPLEEDFNPDEIKTVYQKVYSEDLYPAIHSLLIVRNGKLVAEAYCRDKNEINLFHHIQSATKSITSILTGIAIDHGLIDSVKTPLYYFIPEYFDSDVRKREITIHHVLTMETGLDFDNDIHTIELFNGTGSSLEYVLHKKLLFLPGSDWYYGDGNPQLISGIIQKTSGKSEEDFAVEHLLSPLGIKNYQWEKHADGLTFGAFGLWLIPRDMAKIGKMMQQNGMWENTQIVSAAWIAESTKLQSTHHDYGYYWYPLDEEGAFYAQGHGGQLIYVVQNLQLVVVITADSYSNSAALRSNFQLLFNDIIEAIE
jgi:CubicO group peptidase (beta-lactamase class C family)